MLDVVVIHEAGHMLACKQLGLEAWYATGEGYYAVEFYAASDTLLNQKVFAAGLAAEIAYYGEPCSSEWALAADQAEFASSEAFLRTAKKVSRWFSKEAIEEEAWAAWAAYKGGS